MRRTLEVAERCNVSLELGAVHLPQYPTPEGRDAFDYLLELCEKGLERRYDKVTTELRERLQFELKTIKEMGFADYFLIVWDFIHFAKTNGISVGPGRGSAAGSLAAYCLADHRRRPDALRPALRALPQPGPRRPAGHGHRLLGRRPRAGDQLRRREVRPRPRRPDHHLRDDGRPRRRPRRRPRARDPLRRRRPDREADPGRPGPDARGLPEVGRAEDRLRRATRSRRRSSTSRSRSRGSSGRTRSTPPASSSAPSR